MIDINEYIQLPPGFVMESKSGIHAIMQVPFKNKLDAFLNQFLKIQQSEKFKRIPFELYAPFPNVDLPDLKNEIFSRKQDLIWLENRIYNKINASYKILEIGGWNGWLTNRLFKYSKNLISMDIFEDEYNGLSSKNHHTPNNWFSLQADVTDTSIFKTKFDFIVFNHCLQFYPQPIKLIEKYKQLLNTNGQLIILGADIWWNRKTKEKKVYDQIKYFENKYSFKIHFYDCEGFFDATFYKDLINQGFEFNAYTLSLLSKLKKRFLQQKAGIFIFTKQ